MKNDRKTKSELIAEMESIRRKAKKLETLLKKCKHAQQDITERKQREEKLRESEARYKSLFENSMMGISQALPDGRLICANSAYAKMYGYENPEEIMAAVSHVGQQLYANPEDREEIVRMLKEKGIMEPREMTVKRRDGTLFYVLVSAREIKDSQGTLLYYQAEHVDITKSKKAEEAMRATDERYRYLFDASPDGIAVIGPDGRITSANIAQGRMYRYDSPTDLIGVHATDLIAKSSRDYSQQILQRRLNGEDIPPVEYELIRKDGTTFYGETSATLLQRADRTVSGYLCTTHDTTERKRAEAELRKSHNELRMLANHLQTIREEERKHFAREFHDQIGQSMTALKMDLSLLLRMISDEKQDIQRGLVADELRSMQKLVDETIKLIWAIITELRPQMLEDLGLITTFGWEAKQFESRTGISSEFTSSAGDIQMDSKKSIALFRIYQEALTNVANHANATVVRSVLRRDNEELVFEVKDNGRGITRDEQVRPDSFGLIGMRERALALGGSCEISGNPGEGTTVIVKLPIEQGDEQENTSQ